MKPKGLEDPIMERAFSRYIEEINKHLNEAKTVIEEVSSLSKEQIETAVRRFHTIRGGAGFFGLKEIADTAKEIEKILIQNKKSQSKETRLEILNLIKDIEGDIAR